MLLEKLSFFDDFIDSVFFLNENKEIVYCNNAAAVTLNSSVKRLTKNKKLLDLIVFKDFDKINTESDSQCVTIPFTEVTFELKNKSKNKDIDYGKVQILVNTTEFEGEKYCMVVLHDVTLEEKLQIKYLIELKTKEKVNQELQQASSALQLYSKNLEKLVSDRTTALNSVNVMLNAIMDSLGQGFVVFNEMGKCEDIHTMACEEILETNPSGMDISEVLSLKGEEKAQMGKWITTVFSEILPFESLKELGPQTYNHSEDKYICLEFYPIRNEDNKIQNMVLVATDKTIEYKASKIAEKEKQFSTMMLRIVKNKEQFIYFLSSAKERIKTLQGYCVSTKTFDLKDTFRVLHTLEGESGVFGAKDLGLAAKSSQAIIEPIKQGYADSVDEFFDAFKESIEELTEIYNHFVNENKNIFYKLGVFGNKKKEIEEITIKDYFKLLRNNHVSPKLRAVYKEDFLKEPIENSIIHYDEVIQAVAFRQNKIINELKVIGGDIKIDALAYKKLFSALVHAFRNAVDHGIEDPDDRAAKGKPRDGNIVVFCEKIEKENGDLIKICVKDNGRGVDPEMIKKKMAENTGDEKYLKYSDEDALQLVFHAGLSSRENISEFSGRGVGMDAIMEEVLAIGGKAWVESTLGVGTELYIVVPEIENIELEFKIA